MPFSIFKKKPPVPEPVQEPGRETVHDLEPDRAQDRTRKRRKRHAPMPERSPTPAERKRIHNKHRVLRVMGRFAIVDTHFTALAAFKGYQQPYEMARRTLKSLLADGCIIPRTGVHGADVFVLTDIGAEIVSKLLHSDVTSGIHLRTPTSPTLLHRLLGSYYLLHFEGYLLNMGAECQYITEREIERREDSRYIDPKSTIRQRRPDGLILIPDDHNYDAIWVEVERGYKTHKRFDEQLSGLLPMIDKNIAPNNEREVMLRDIHYVADPDVVDLIALGASIRKVATRSNHIDQLSRIFVYRADIQKTYHIVSLSGLLASEIPERIPDDHWYDTDKEALEKEFDQGTIISAHE